jgi:large subunit ribosomal protein L15|tara:strand:- start:876 stop:1325 length:450 start_codon:yes stop_codon:yes gene_type:complete
MQNHTIKSSGAKSGKRKRVGRGDGSGNGSFSGKGMKGQNSRSGGGVRPGFEGGQIALIKRMPSLRGFTNIFKTKYHLVNIDSICRVYPDGGEVSPQGLVQNGVIKDEKLPLKILGRGEITVNLKVSAHKFTKSAKSKIEMAGGTIQVID